MAQTIAAFSVASQESNRQPANRSSKVDDRLEESLISAEMLEAKTNRDVVSGFKFCLCSPLGSRSQMTPNHNTWFVTEHPVVTLTVHKTDSSYQK